MGNEPIESEIPVELSDLPELVQISFQVYGYLKDIWEGSTGTYMGKDIPNIFQILEILDINEKSERKLILELVVLIDSARSKQISSSKPKNKTPTT